jgi:hypothetical protein
MPLQLVAVLLAWSDASKIGSTSPGLRAGSIPQGYRDRSPLAFADDRLLESLALLPC